MSVERNAVQLFYTRIINEQKYRDANYLINSARDETNAMQNHATLLLFATVVSVFLYSNWHGLSIKAKVKKFYYWLITIPAYGINNIVSFILVHLSVKTEAYNSSKNRW